MSRWWDFFLLRKEQYQQWELWLGVCELCRPGGVRTALWIPREFYLHLGTCRPKGGWFCMLLRLRHCPAPSTKGFESHFQATHLICPSCVFSNHQQDKDRELLWEEITHWFLGSCFEMFIGPVWQLKWTSCITGGTAAADTWAHRDEQVGWDVVQSSAASEALYFFGGWFFTGACVQQRGKTPFFPLHLSFIISKISCSVNSNNIRWGPSFQSWEIKHLYQFFTPLLPNSPSSRQVLG